MKKLTIDEFIKKSNIIHNNIYDYSLVNYKNSSIKIKIICHTHGIFEQTPNNHISQKQGCPKCAGKGKELLEIIEDFNKIHNFKYDYSLINYKNKRSNLKIICTDHGIFEQISYSHLSGIGCPKCGGSFRTTTEEFINKSNKIHNNKYDYSLVDYKSAHKKVKIICPEHGSFEQSPNGHLRGNKCPKCELDMSKGELKITEYLKNENINFVPQHTFIDCKNIRCLPFDFYLPIYNICIEFDGIQHFKASKSWGGEQELEIRKIRDQIKTDYCKNNNIKLLRIKYNENILDKLNSHIHF